MKLFEKRIFDFFYVFLLFKQKLQKNKQTEYFQSWSLKRIFWFIFIEFQFFLSFCFCCTSSCIWWNGPKVSKIQFAAIVYGFSLMIFMHAILRQRKIFIHFDNWLTDDDERLMRKRMLNSIARKKKHLMVLLFMYYFYRIIYFQCCI